MHDIDILKPTPMALRIDSFIVQAERKSIFTLSSVAMRGKRRCDIPGKSGRLLDSISNATYFRSAMRQALWEWVSDLLSDLPPGK